MADFRVTRYKIRIDDERKKPDRPFTAVLLSDLHNMSYGENNQELLSEIRNQSPDLIFAAGDMMTSAEVPQMDASIRLMKDLTKKYPVFYVNGNHEQRLKAYPERYGGEEVYEEYAETIKSFGVRLLENAGERIEIHKMMMTVTGYELPMECYARFRKRELASAEIEKALGKKEDSTFQVLLAHNPLYFPVYAEWGADLTLSGHLHGGIVRIPFVGGVVSPQFRLFPNYTKGIYKEDGKRMIVSAGLGSHTIKLRINNPPELVVIDFV